jgi:hypothetical protein
MKKRTIQKQSKNEQKLNANAQIDVRPDTPNYYINYILVSHTAYDFTLSAAKIPSPYTPEQIDAAKAGKPISLEATVQVVFPSLLIDGLIKALVIQKEKQEQTSALQVKNNEQQQQQQ